MAKRSKTKNSSPNKSRRGRNVSTIANHRLPLAHGYTPRLVHKINANILDARYFHPIIPASSRPVFTTSGDTARIQPSTSRRNPNARYLDSFAIPTKVVPCVRRKQRREVLFATQRSGRNGGRRYRRNSTSSISC